MSIPKCKDCSTTIYSDYNMVILNDYLWSKICDNHKDLICDECIEKRMNREIKLTDLQLSYGDHIPCNIWWLKNKKNINIETK